MIRFGLQANCPSLAGAIEKQKLVYILNRDAAARLTISSPLEAHKANTLVYHVVGVDVGFENPMFACLEMDYEVSRGDLPWLSLELCPSSSCGGWGALAASPSLFLKIFLFNCKSANFKPLKCM